MLKIIDDNYIKQPVIKEGLYNETPEFYKSMSNNPSRARFASGVDIRSATFKVSEILEGYTDTGTLILPFKRIYKTTPLVSGIKQNRNGDYNILILSEDLMFVDTSLIRFRPSIFDPANNIYYVKVKIYSLDNVTNNN